MSASDSAFAIAMLCFIADYLVGDSQGIVVWKAVGLKHTSHKGRDCGFKSHLAHPCKSLVCI